jgi:hypothetical protein
MAMRLCARFMNARGTFEPPGLFRLPALDNSSAVVSPVVGAASMVYATQVAGAASEESSATMTPLVLSSGKALGISDLKGY